MVSKISANAKYEREKTLGNEGRGVKMQCSAVQCNAMQYNAMQCEVIATEMATERKR